MRRVFQLLVIVGVLYVILQLGFGFITKGHTINYQVSIGDGKASIKEVFTTGISGEKDNYYFEISVNDKVFDYQTFVNFNMQNKIIRKVYYYEDSTYSCVLPIFTKENIISDIICKSGDIYYPYRTIKNTNRGLDSFASSLVDIGYSIDPVESTALGEEKTGKAYYSYFNHFFSLENYKGIYTLNKNNLKRLSDVEIFKNDVYTKNISAYVDNYYIVADYTKNYKFNVFNVINILDNSKSKITYDYDIYMDSYVQGVVGDEVYLFDKTTLKQYEINVKAKTIVEVGNEQVGIKIYKNGSFSTVSAYDAKNNNIYFNDYTTDNVYNNMSYEKVDKIGIEKSGYYYIFEKSQNNYKVYRSNVQNPTTKTYLFETNNIKNIIYIDDYIYYQFKDSIYSYSDKNGIVKIMTDSELTFKTDLKFNVYEK